MSVILIPEEDLRGALRPFRVEPERFEAGVEERLKASVWRANDEPWASLSPLPRSAAAFLPLQIIAGGKLPAAVVHLMPATGAYKLLGYLAFPAISLFVLLGATIFSFVRIRNVPEGNGAEFADEQARTEAIRQWWRDHKWGAWFTYGVTLSLAMVGATWLLFLFFIASFGLLLYTLTSFGKVGLGNRQLISQSCMMGLVLLGQLAVFPSIGFQEIHLVDQKLIAVVFYIGALGLLPMVIVNSIASSPRVAGSWLPVMPRAVRPVLSVLVIVPLVIWFMTPIFWPTTPARIKSYVESFSAAPFSSSSWHQWEIPASWTIQSKLDPDLTAPRRLLAAELAGQQNPFILGGAFRVGLIDKEQLGQLRDYENQRHFLLDDPYQLKEARAISSLAQEDWVIRAAVMRNDLTNSDRDYLEKRLKATLEELPDGPYAVLLTALRVTQLLDVIDRPIDRQQYRGRVHDWLRKFHDTGAGWGLQLAGGFKVYANLSTGSLETTSHAVELMEFYGIPDEFDLNWVRSYLRPLYFRPMNDPWMAAVTLDRLNRLPGATQPTWLDYLYYERSLLAAVVLVGLCTYATLRSPMQNALGAADSPSAAIS